MPRQRLRLGGLDIAPQVTHRYLSDGDLSLA